MTKALGKVYLVGAGPGDPGLLTCRGASALAMADVVVYDHLASPMLLDLAPPRAERICGGKSIGHCTMAQAEISGILIDRARQGRTVVRLKGGDPLVFGRGGEEAMALRAAGIPFEIVPGVTAGLGALAYAGIPVTHRGFSSAVAFVTGHDDPEAASEGNQLDWGALARFPGTLVIYMGVTHLESICQTLIRLGKPAHAPAAIVESGSLAQQRTMVGTVQTIAREGARAGAKPPALLVIGEVVRLRELIAWYEQLPLFGQRIVVTRPREEGYRVAAAMAALGAEVLLAPTVEVRPMADPQALDSVIGRLSTYDWLVFTSSAGVRFFLQRLAEIGRDLRALGHLKLAAIGPTTADALREYHLRADLVPDAYRSEALAQALGLVAGGRKILLARADRGRPILKEMLDTVATVDQVAVYENADVTSLPASVVERLEDGTVDWITVTSSAIAARLFELLPGPAKARIGSAIRLASLSPVTTATVTALGFDVSAEATEYTWDGLVRAIIDQVSRDRARRAAPGAE